MWSWVVAHSAAAALAVGIVVGLSAAATGAEAPAATAGRRVVYLFRDALWSAHADGTQARPLTTGKSVYAYDVTPGGDRVAFAAGAWRVDRKRRELVASEVWLVNADGTGLRRLGLPPLSSKGAPARIGHVRWSPDGRSLAFDVVGGRARGDRGGMLYVLDPLDGQVLVVVKGAVHSFAWTPDGRLTYRQDVHGEAAPAEWVVTPDGSPPARLADPGQNGASGPQAVMERGTATAPPVPQLAPSVPAHLEAARNAIAAFGGPGAD